LIMAQNETSKRAASVLAIAQHKFKQNLKREDNEARLPPVSVELSSQFLSDIDAVLRQNTSKCTGWIVKHIVPSRNRIMSLGDYLISVSKSVVVDRSQSAATRKAARIRFTPLLIISDVLHTDKYHQRSSAKQSIFSRESGPFVTEIVELAAACVCDKESQTESRLRALLNYWAINELLSQDNLKAIRDRADEAFLIAQGGTPARKRNYLLPEYHGDRNAPWYDLPVAYMLDQMITNPNRPIDPRRIKVARLDKKPVSSRVRNLLNTYFENIDLKYVPTGDNPTGETHKYKLWLDPMGQLVKQNKESGDTSAVCNGYGWSTKLCQDMQKDGVPETIRKAREEAQREAEMEMARPPPQQRNRSTHAIVAIVAHPPSHRMTAGTVAPIAERDHTVAVAVSHPNTMADTPTIAVATKMMELVTQRDRQPDLTAGTRPIRNYDGTRQLGLRDLHLCPAMANILLLPLHYRSTVKHSPSLHNLHSMHHISLRHRCLTSFRGMVRTRAASKVDEVAIEAAIKVVGTMVEVGMAVSSVVGDGTNERKLTAPHELSRTRHVMSSQKRKRTTHRSKPAKRPKYTESGDIETSPSEQLWEADSILQERRIGRRLQYLIKWKGIDPNTGEDYEPTWEPEENPTAALLADWEELKARQNVASADPVAEANIPQPRPSRKSCVVQSSPEPSTAHSYLASSQPSALARDSFMPAAAFSALTTPIGPSTASRRVSPRVQLKHPSGELDLGEYERFSQLAPSNPPSKESQTQERDLDSSQVFAAVSPYRSSGVVPDSQSSAGKRSFATATQQTTSTTQQSSTTSETQEDVTEDSGILEIVQAGASRVHSPARSIPETVYDNTADSQSQRRRAQSPERIEIESSPESVESDSLFIPEHPEEEHREVGRTHQEVNVQLGAQVEGQREDSGSASQQVAPANRPSSAPAIESPTPSQDLDLPADKTTQAGRHLREQSAPTTIDSCPGGEPQSAASPTAQETAERTNDPSLLTNLEPAREDIEAGEQDGEITGKLLAVVGAKEPPQISEPQPLGSQDLIKASIAEHSVQDEVAQFPFHAQHPLHEAHESAHPAEPVPNQQPSIVPPVANFADAHAAAVDQTLPKEASACNSVNSPLPASIATAIKSQPLSNELLVRSTQPDDDNYSKELAESEPHQDPSPLFESEQQTESESIVQLTYHSQETREASVRRRDFAFESLVPHSTGQSTSSREQNAQVIPADNDLSTQDNTTESIRPTIEKVDAPVQSSPDSRHDSGLLPSVDGTRSPSTVPDRLPAPPAPTSLRTIALTQSVPQPAEEAREEPAGRLSEDVPDQPVQIAKPAVPAIVTTHPTVPEASSSDDEELMDVSDDDDDTASLLNDDLSLAVEEHVVPLFIEGRQSDMYSAYIKQKQELLNGFIMDPQGFEPLAQVDEVLSYLRAIETHIDLVFAEAQDVSEDAMSKGTQIKFAAQFGMENSTKFRFLHLLFHALRDQQKHVVLVVEENRDSLFNIIETFCEANFIDYNMPTKGRRADPATVEGSLSVSVLPDNTSPNLRPADVIICLNGVQDATQIRTKNWAANPEVEVVPVLHLVIPRTVGHIERYLSSSLDRRDRIHTILASLGQMRDELGKPIDEDTPHALIAAAQVANWLTASPKDKGVWPLGSIGSVKDVVEYQTQMSQTSATSPPPERAKRPHDDEELDSAKRMRFTPQPQNAPASSGNNDNDVTRISDSMPGTARDDISAHNARLARIEEAYQQEHFARKLEAARYAEKESMWEKQQYVHEDLSKQYRLLLGKQQSNEEKLETMTKNNDTLRERLATRTTEMGTLREQLTEQRNTHLLSDDAKIAEITRLRTDLATANDDKSRALKTAQTSDSTLEYMKEQYRAAQDAATTTQSTVSELEDQIQKLTHQASGEPTKLKAMHLDRQYENLANQVKALKAENGILRTSLKQKDEELARAKMSAGRMGVGTRAASATPKPRSRAASPMAGGRLSYLRNG
ncbi:hypothetical protein EK21DRAFT_76254, partial [Setomelanomma holmii]